MYFSNSNLSFPKYSKIQINTAKNDAGYLYCNWRHYIFINKLAISNCLINFF